MNGTASADRGRCESPRGGGSVESPRPQSSSPGLLRNQIHTRSRVDVNGNTRLEIVPIEQELAFDKGLYMFIRAVQKLRQVGGAQGANPQLQGLSHSLTHPHPVSPRNPCRSAWRRTHGILLNPQRLDTWCPRARLGAHGCSARTQLSALTHRECR